MVLKKSEIYSTLTKCANKLRSNSGIGAESFKNYVLIILFLKYISDKVKSDDNTVLEIPEGCYFEDIVALKGKKHWRCIEYIVVHEMTHLKQHCHNKDFIHLFDVHLPDWQLRKKELDEFIALPLVGED